MEQRWTPRRQGDLGELSAMDWLAKHDALVFTPLLHSPDYDLGADVRAELLRVQVKTSTCRERDRDRWVVALCTRGGNQSWNGIIKRVSADRCDWVFVHFGDGRRWFIPVSAIEGGSSICLGGPKYAEFEVENGDPLPKRPRLLAAADVSRPTLD